LWIFFIIWAKAPQTPRLTFSIERSAFGFQRPARGITIILARRRAAISSVEE
jgi:hypothetical protein